MRSISLPLNALECGLVHPQILWMTCGNTSNARLREVLLKSSPEARAILEQGESLVEISDARQE